MDEDLYNSDGDGDGELSTRPTPPAHPISDSAAYAMMFAILADAINIMCLAPNLPLMVTPGNLHDDSFPSTEPFDPTTAQYAHDGVEAFAMVISSLFFGYIADKIGCRKAVLILTVGSGVSAIGKYLVRRSYWEFIIMAAVNGKFLCACVCVCVFGFVAFHFCRAHIEHSGALLPAVGFFGSAHAVGNGYVCLIYKNDREKADAFIGHMMVTHIIGLTLGGLLTLISPHQLFLPLLPAALLNGIAFIVAYMYIVEPSNTEKEGDICNGAESGHDDDSPDTFDNYGFFTIIFGSFVDHLGTLGVYRKSILIERRTTLNPKVRVLNFIDTSHFFCACFI